MRQWFWKVLSKFGIWKLMTWMGIDCILLKWKYRKDIEKDRCFYNNHKERIKEVLSILEDDLSKEHYQNAWKFRISYSKNKRPLSSKSPYLNNQYFVESLVHLSHNEVFVDGGAFDGDTYEQFKYATRNQFCTYVAYEPDGDNCRKLRSKTENDTRVVIRDKGIWDEEGVFSSCKGRGENSKLSTNGDIKVKVGKLDNDPVCQNATYIKMDIEGAELKALQGAKNILLRNLPKLAICIYHSAEDMTDIILWVHHLCPAYKIYVRHHSMLAGETVMYAFADIE